MPPSLENKKANGWPIAIRDIIVKALVTGNIVPLGLLIIIGGIIWKLDSKDLKDLISSMVSSKAISIAGWVLFFGLLFLVKRLMNWREDMHQKEIDRMAAVRNEAIQKHFELTLPTSKQ